MLKKSRLYFYPFPCQQNCCQRICWQIIALKQEVGETVTAAKEVLQVAKDICDYITYFRQENEKMPPKQLEVLKVKLGLINRSAEADPAKIQVAS